MDKMGRSGDGAAEGRVETRIDAGEDGEQVSHLVRYSLAMGDILL